MPTPLTLAWVDAYALETLHSLSKVDRYLTRARELLSAGKLQQCTWQDDGGLQAVAAGSSASDAYIVALLPAVPGPYTTSCSCPRCALTAAAAETEPFNDNVSICMLTYDFEDKVCFVVNGTLLGADTGSRRAAAIGGQGSRLSASMTACSAPAAKCRSLSLRTSGVMVNRLPASTKALIILLCNS
jgi:hypothetical protein